MSRPYFKHDLYHFSGINEAKKKKDRQKIQKNAPIHSIQQIVIGKQEQQAALIGAHKKLVVKTQSEDQQDDQFKKAFIEMQMKMKKKNQISQSKGNKESLDSQKCQKVQNNQVNINSNKKIQNKKFNMFTPKNTLKIPQLKTQQTKDIHLSYQQDRKQKWSMIKLRKQLTKVMNCQQVKKQITQKKQSNIEQAKDKFQQNVISQSKKEEEENQSQKSESQKPGKIKSTRTRKQKRIKKQANYVRTDLKRKYRDRFVGELNKNLRKFTKSGRLKSKYRKLQAQLQLGQGDIYNSFTISLSRALFVNIDLDQDGQVIDSQKLTYTVPETFERQNLQKLIKEVFGFQKFRQGQYETIKNILQGKSTLFVSQTASGKSLTYIVSSIILKGLSIVISPLVSLMLDQIDHLPSDLPAACISSLLNHDQKDRIINMVKQGKIQLLFITPQSFLTDFMYHVRQFPPISFVCIDEAHSMSELSHSFRASYLTLQQIVLKYFKYRSVNPVVLCLTATANIETMQSISQKLKISEKIKSKSVINKNLFITISRQHLSSKYQAVLKYLSHPQIKKCKGILVYCRTKKIMYEIFNYLRNSSLICFIYHSALSQRQKVQILQKFRRGQIKIVIATIALGMGLDFQNLQCVIHINMPKSVQNYIQQIGRAGRRQRRAYCHLFLDKYDYFTQRNYFLADQLDNKIYKNLLQIIKFQSTYTRHKVLNNQLQQQTQNLKRLSIKQNSNEDDKIYQEDQEPSKQKNQSKSNQKLAINQKSLSKDNQKDKLNQNNNQECAQQSFQLSFYKTQIFTQKLGLKQEAILNLLIKIQKILGQKTFKMHPMSYQILKISFFKKNEQQIKQKSQFYTKLVKDCRVVKGTIFIPLVRKCNQLKLTPIMLLSEVYGLSANYCLKIQLVNDIFVWQHRKSKQRTLQLMQSNDISKKIIEQFNLIQRTSLVKFNILYSLCFNNSSKSINNIIDKNQIISEKDRLPENSVISNFDKYFSQQTYQLYRDIVKQAQGQIQEEQLRTKIFNHEAAYLPITEINQQDKKQINSCVQMFLKHVINNNPDKKLHQSITPYRDGRVITRVFMGVNDTKSNWKTYGEHPYWMKFVDKDYRKLLTVVKSSIIDFVFNEGSKILMEENKKTVSS